MLRNLARRNRMVAACVISSLIARIILNNGRELFCVLRVDCRHTVYTTEGKLAVCECARDAKPTDFRLLVPVLCGLSSLDQTLFIKGRLKVRLGEIIALCTISNLLSLISFRSY